MIRTVLRAAARRLLTAAGLARAADVDRERQAVAAVRRAERTRAAREAAAASGRLKALDEKLRTAQEHASAEHADRTTLLGMLRHYLIRLTRTEAQLAGTLASERRIKLAQLAIAARTARRNGVSPTDADRAAQFASTNAEYAAAAARWRAGPDATRVRSATMAGLQWSVPADGTGAAPPETAWLPMQDLTTVRQFAVGGVMLDIGAWTGAACIPRVLLGDFALAYAAEPDSDAYACLVGNTLDNSMEGLVLADRIAIADATGSVTLAGPGGKDAERVPALTLDAWVDRMRIPVDEVRFARITLQPWNLHVLEGAARLLPRRQVVWQLQLDSAVMGASGGATADLAALLARHFTHVKEIGGYYGAEWHRASEAAEVLHALGADRRAANLLVFNLRASSGPRGRRRRPLHGEQRAAAS